MIFLPLLTAIYSLILSIYTWSSRPDGVTIGFLANSILVIFICIVLSLVIKMKNKKLKLVLVSVSFILLLVLCLQWVALFGFQNP
jgi:Ca2+/Na+ antiporter